MAGRVEVLLLLLLVCVIASVAGRSVLTGSVELGARAASSVSASAAASASSAGRSASAFRDASSAATVDLQAVPSLGRFRETIAKASSPLRGVAPAARDGHPEWLTIGWNFDNTECEGKGWEWGLPIDYCFHDEESGEWLYGTLQDETNTFSFYRYREEGCTDLIEGFESLPCDTCLPDEESQTASKWSCDVVHVDDYWNDDGDGFWEDYPFCGLPLLWTTYWDAENSDGTCNPSTVAKDQTVTVVNECFTFPVDYENDIWYSYFVEYDPTVARYLNSFWEGPDCKGTPVIDGELQRCGECYTNLFGSDFILPCGDEPFEGWCPKDDDDDHERPGAYFTYGYNWDDGNIQCADDGEYFDLPLWICFWDEEDGNYIWADVDQDAWTFSMYRFSDENCKDLIWEASNLPCDTCLPDPEAGSSSLWSCDLQFRPDPYCDRSLVFLAYWSPKTFDGNCDVSTADEESIPMVVNDCVNWYLDFFTVISAFTSFNENENMFSVTYWTGKDCEGDVFFDETLECNECFQDPFGSILRMECDQESFVPPCHDDGGGDGDSFWDNAYCGAALVWNNYWENSDGTCNPDTVAEDPSVTVVNQCFSFPVDDHEEIWYSYFIEYDPTLARYANRFWESPDCEGKPALDRIERCGECYTNPFGIDYIIPCGQEPFEGGCQDDHHPDLYTYGWIWSDGNLECADEGDYFEMPLWTCMWDDQSQSYMWVTVEQETWTFSIHYFADKECKDWTWSEGDMPCETCLANEELGQSLFWSCEIRSWEDDGDDDDDDDDHDDECRVPECDQALEGCMQGSSMCDCYGEQALCYAQNGCAPETPIEKCLFLAATEDPSCECPVSDLGTPAVFPPGVMPDAYSFESSITLEDDSTVITMHVRFAKSGILFRMDQEMERMVYDGKVSVAGAFTTIVNLESGIAYDVDVNQEQCFLGGFLSDIIDWEDQPNQEFSTQELDAYVGTVRYTDPMERRVMYFLPGTNTPVKYVFLGGEDDGLTFEIVNFVAQSPALELNTDCSPVQDSEEIEELQWSCNTPNGCFRVDDHYDQEGCSLEDAPIVGMVPNYYCIPDDEEGLSFVYTPGGMVLMYDNMDCSGARVWQFASPCSCFYEEDEDKWEEHVCDASDGAFKLHIWRNNEDDCRDGVNIEIFDAPPSSVVALIYGGRTGASTVPNAASVCPGTPFGVGAGYSTINIRTNSDGYVALQTSPRAAVCDWFVQALSFDTCATSHMASI